MITEHTHSENNDWQEPGGEQLSASESSAPSPAMDAPAQEEGQTTIEVRPEETPENGTAQAVEPLSQPTISDPEVQPEPFAQHAVEVEVPLNTSSTSTDDVASTPVEADQFENDAPALFPLEEEPSLPEEEAVRPFTDFIEEFRQTEVRFGASLNEPDASFTAFVAGSEGIHEPVVFLETAPEDLAQIVDVVTSTPDEETPAVEESGEEQTALKNQGDEGQPETIQPKVATERPVSPLLRPARPRLSRHGRHRIEGAARPADPQTEAPKEPEEQPAVEVAASEEPKVEEQPARPARRYRFDRPATTTASLPAARVPTPTTPAQVRGDDAKERRNFATHSDNGVSPEPAVARSNSAANATPEAPAQKAPAQEAAPTTAEVSAPAAPERRRRGNHDRQREKEQATAQVAPVPEPIIAEVEPMPVVEEETPVEDLPPLEYSELQAASSRRRRRRRAGSASTAASNGAVTPKASLPDLATPTPPPSSPVLPRSAASLQAYNIVSGYTVSQMNQGNDMTGPFMGPEPSPARGSTFGSTPALRHVRNEALRSTPAHPAKHSEGPMMSPASVNHLANVVAQAMQTQTDRMVAEMRRANQVPTNVSVSLPPFPSTERVGVFVDVANLLYSARTLRMTVDFGKLLDFLRGNRRLVRAQAYCPTSPQPGDDQMFLQAVKGLGYRITTKNYKTFSSGAKKADLDLDLCMDVVRLVDGKAVDCIVLVSGDSDFMPMLDYCSDHGVRVEVAAFDESMSATLRQSCDLFVNLSMLEEIRV